MENLDFIHATVKVVHMQLLCYFTHMRLLTVPRHKTFGLNQYMQFTGLLQRNTRM